MPLLFDALQNTDFTGSVKISYTYPATWCDGYFTFRTVIKFWKAQMLVNYTAWDQDRSSLKNLLPHDAFKNFTISGMSALNPFWFFLKMFHIFSLSSYINEKLTLKKLLNFSKIYLMNIFPLLLKMMRHHKLWQHLWNE